MKKTECFLTWMVFSFLMAGCPHLPEKSSEPQMRKFDEGVTTLSEAEGIKEVRACSLYTHDEGTSSAKQRVVQKAINEVAPTFGIIVKGKNSIIVNCLKETQEIERCIENTNLENKQTIIENAYTIKDVKYPILDEQRVCVAVIVKIDTKPDDIAPPIPKNTPLFEGYQFLKAGEWDKAESKFNQASRHMPRSAAPWYWLARLALARDNKQISLHYLDKALEYDPAHIHSLALQMKVLLLMGGHNITKAKALGKSIYARHPSQALKNWSICVEGISGFIITATEIESRCQAHFPVYQWK